MNMDGMLTVRVSTEQIFKIIKTKAAQQKLFGVIVIGVAGGVKNQVIESMMKELVDEMYCFNELSAPDTGRLVNAFNDYNVVAVVLGSEASSITAKRITLLQ